MSQTRSLKEFKKLKEDNCSSYKTKKVHTIILGNDPIGYKVLSDFYKNNNTDVVLLHDEDFSSPLNRFSLSMLRGDYPICYFQENFPTLELSKNIGTPLFYKDGEFKEFGGRSKSHEILSKEEYFLAPSTNFDQIDWIKSQIDLFSLQESFVKGLIKEINCTVETDLDASANWEIILKDNSKFICDELVVAMSPKNFTSYLNDYSKGFIDQKFLSYANGIEHFATLSIQFLLKKPVSDYKNTCFVPQSLTHEWGSFICEFGVNKDSYQILTAVSFLEENETDHEECTKKVKLLKRVLERVFPELEKNILNENIQVRFNDFTILPSDQELTVENKPKNVTFVGPEAPIFNNQFEKDKFKYVARSLYSYFQNAYLTKS